MKNPIGPYPGRQLFLGLTLEGNPCLAYLITGRSPESRERKAVRKDNKVIIGPLGNVEYDPLRHYTALQYDNNSGIAAITNGIQTEAIFEAYHLLYNVKSVPAETYLATLMDGAGHEPDSLNTPRISGIITHHENKPVCILSIKRREMKTFAHKVDLKQGLITGISTYNGSLESPLPYDPTHGLPEIKLNATRVGEIAGLLFDISAATNKGLDIRVSTVAAVFTGNGWDVAVVNAQ
jgi:IMP cyclohydrolase